MKTFRFVLVVAGCCAALAGPATAAGESLGSGPLTLMQARTMDANKDGVISKQEYARRSADMASWSEMDANDDGVLDAAEQRRSMRPAPIRIR